MRCYAFVLASMVNYFEIFRNFFLDRGVGVWGVSYPTFVLYFFNFFYIYKAPKAVSFGPYRWHYKKCGVIKLRASAGRSSIRQLRKDFTNDERKCNSFRQFDESNKTTY